MAEADWSILVCGGPLTALSSREHFGQASGERIHTDRLALLIQKIVTLYGLPFKRDNCCWPLIRRSRQAHPVKLCFVHAAQAQQPADRRRQMSAKRPGRYLAQTSASYMFQIRLPSKLDAGRSLIRISLQTRRLADARWLAEALAVEARLLFKAELQETRQAGGNPLAKPGIQAFEIGRAAGVCLAPAIKRRLKAELALMTAEAQSPACATGQQHLLSPQPDIADTIKLAARIAVDEFLMEAADRIKQKLEGKLAKGCQQSSRENVSQSVPEMAVSTDGFAERRAGKKGGAAFKREGSLLSPHEPDRRGDTLPAFLLDRRAVPRKRSRLPRFSLVAADYLKLRSMVTPENRKDIDSARLRISVFLDLIGDHPVDRYEAADLQAFVLLMADWPAKPSLRNRGSATQVLEESRRLGHRPLAEKSVKDGYVAAVRAAMRSGMTSYSYRDPFQDVSLRFPCSLAPSRQTASLSGKQLTTLFRIGVDAGCMDTAMLPLLGHLTGRRLSALIYLRGIDIVEKFDNVWVAQPKSLVEIEGQARRVPLKTKASLSFFVLHAFFHRIGFIQWAISCGNQFLFPDLMRLADPSKSASQYMQRLFRKAGIAPGCGEVFHSLRGDYIDTLRYHQVGPRAGRIQVGHSLGADVHAHYGLKSLNEASAVALAGLPMRPDVDYSVFETLDFVQLADNHRRKGVRGVVPR